MANTTTPPQVLRQFTCVMVAGNANAVFPCDLFACHKCGAIVMDVIKHYYYHSNKD
jgi:hypothetical protein